jgi:hypothetical protein
VSSNPTHVVGVFDTTLCDKGCQGLMAGQRFPQVMTITPMSYIILVGYDMHHYNMSNVFKKQN